jgi:hypothetical protein
MQCDNSFAYFDKVLEKVTLKLYHVKRRNTIIHKFGNGLI